MVAYYFRSYVAVHLNWPRFLHVAKKFCEWLQKITPNYMVILSAIKIFLVHKRPTKPAIQFL